MIPKRYQNDTKMIPKRQQNHTKTTPKQSLKDPEMTPKRNQNDPNTTPKRSQNMFVRRGTIKKTGRVIFACVRAGGRGQTKDPDPDPGRKNEIYMELIFLGTMI